MRKKFIKKDYCPVCRDLQEHYLILVGRKGFGDIYRCLGCKLRRLLPVPSLGEQKVAIEGMYQREAKDFSTKKMSFAKQSVKGYVRHLSKYTTKINSLVDLAGGLGYYASAFAERGIKVTYVDADPVSVDFVKKKHCGRGVDVFKATIEEFCQSAESKFDVIFLRHVIEHCVRPDETLDLIRSISHKDSILVLETDNNLGIELLFHPDSRGYWRKVYQQHYNEKSILNLCRLQPLAIDFLETHCFAFRLDNLSILLNRTGWLILDKFHYSLGDPIYWPNLPGVKEMHWWKARRNFTRWFYEVEYSLIYKILRRFNWTAGLAVYARLNHSN